MSNNDWVQTWDIPSDSNPEKFYRIGRKQSGEYGCSCPSWTRNRAKLANGYCKHIKSFLAGKYSFLGAVPPQMPLGQPPSQNTKAPHTTASNPIAQPPKGHYDDEIDNMEF